MRRALAGMAAAVALTACGSSKHVTTAPVTHASSTPRSTTTPGASTTSPPSTTPPPTSTAGASNVRLPATFTIGAGGKLSPPTVAAPAGVTIQLKVISGDGRAHRLTVGGRALAVPAGGRVSTALNGLRRGRYAVLVDGTPGGTLIVGAQPGP